MGFRVYGVQGSMQELVGCFIGEAFTVFRSG